MTAAVAITRRRALLGAAGGVAVVLAGGAELVSRGVLPGHSLLDTIDGACDVAEPAEVSERPGPEHTTGRFYSRARGREVAYTVAYPPGHGPGDALPMALVLHGFGGNHLSSYGNLSLAQALATRRRGTAPRPPVALVAPDGGPLYWNAHPGDDPMAMLADELLPLCARLGLRTARIGVTGISMGGYGSLLFAERHPDRTAVVAAISPAVWTSYAQARAANPGAYASAADFARDDVVTHTGALAGHAVRVASGSDDPFYPNVQTLARRLPPGAAVVLGSGCHDGAFFGSQRSASLDFVPQHLVA